MHLRDFKPGDLITLDGNSAWEVMYDGTHKYIRGDAYTHGYTTGAQPGGGLTILIDYGTWHLYDDFDEFTKWVKSEQEKAKATKYNKEFRQFVDRRAKISRLGKNQQRGRLQRLGQRR